MKCSELENASVRAPCAAIAPLTLPTQAAATTFNESELVTALRSAIAARDKALEDARAKMRTLMTANHTANSSIVLKCYEALPEPGESYRMNTGLVPHEQLHSEMEMLKLLLGAVAMGAADQQRARGDELRWMKTLHGDVMDALEAQIHYVRVTFPYIRAHVG